MDITDNITPINNNTGIIIDYDDYTTNNKPLFVLVAAPSKFTNNDEPYTNTFFVLGIYSTIDNANLAWSKTPFKFVSTKIIHQFQIDNDPFSVKTIPTINNDE